RPSRTHTPPLPLHDALPIFPNVARRRLAMVRARSSAAPRDAPTITISVAAGNWSMNSQAARRRASADVEVTIRIIDYSGRRAGRSEEHTSELQSRFDLVCRL